MKRLKLTKEEALIYDQRAAKYGDASLGHARLGRMWSALLSQYFGVEIKDIPAHIVETMFALSKLNRIAIEPTSTGDDSFDDAKIYLELARIAKQKERKD